MNLSSDNLTVVVQYRDSLNKAMTKNVIVMVLGISINYINATLIHTFNKHQIFKMNPRYILFIHLVINDMTQLTTSVTLFLLSYTLFTINASFCAILILIVVVTTENTLMNLACMAVECYIAICFPLHHARICTVDRTNILIGLIWVTSLFSVLPDLFVTIATEPLEHFHSRVFCIRDKIFRNPQLHMKRDYYYIVVLVLVWFALFYTYFRILFTARTASSDAKKARNTILLHGFQLLLCMLNYVAPLLKLTLMFLFPTKVSDVLFVSYIIVQILPRFVSPIVYGLRDKTFRRYLKKSLFCRVTIHTNLHTALRTPS